ncbi:hypothetical protein niasHT_026237 [Heterodera trifolii]|uniref:Effector protein n=1 Tax=Heterodera trifolii TaxID=157864 RepID=A0ABD2JC09_9BILA
MENLAKFVLLMALFWNSSAQQPEEGKDKFVLPTETPGYEGKPNEGQVYYAEDGSCGWWDNEQNKYVQPNLKYQPFDFKCLNEFHWHAYGPACGDPFYEFAKHCAMVKFYENKSPKKWIAENNPDSLLVLIDGCVVCDEEGSSGTLANPKDQQIEATIRLQHIWPAGSFFTSCNEANHTAGELHLKLGNATVDISEMNIDSSTSEEGVRTLMEAGRYHYASFSLAAVLFQRQCSGLFSHDPVPEMYQNLSLIVEHNCKGAKATKEIQIQLRDLSHKQFKDNWAELRGLYINLMNPMDTRQYSYVEFKYIDLAENLEGIQWFNLVETEDDGF